MSNLPEPQINTWTQVGDVLDQGGTVEVSQVAKLSEQFKGQTGGSSKQTKS